MLVRDGTVEKMFVEPNEPDAPFRCNVVLLGETDDDYGHFVAHHQR